MQANLLPLAQVESVVKLVDHASEQSLLWIVIALAVCIGVFGTLVIRWLVKWIEARIQMDETHSELRIRVMVENTAMLREVKEVLQDVQTILRQR